MTSKTDFDKKKLIIVGALFVCLIVFLITFFSLGIRNKGRTVSSSLQIEQDANPSEPPETKTITLFFLSEDDFLLHPEDREVIDNPSITLMGRQLVNELLNGSHNGLITPFPSETKLREFYLSNEGTAYVDFSREIRDDHLSGSDADIATVYCVVNSLIFNFEEIKRVFFLIDGRESQTLGGHLNLTRPFSYREDLIIK